MTAIGNKNSLIDWKWNELFPQNIWVGSGRRQAFINRRTERAHRNCRPIFVKSPIFLANIQVISILFVAIFVRKCVKNLNAQNNCSCACLRQPRCVRLQYMATFLYFVWEEKSSETWFICCLATMSLSIAMTTDKIAINFDIL